MKSIEYRSSEGRAPNRFLWTTPVVLVALLLVLNGCKTVQTPVPVYGTNEDIAQLLGEWRGEFSSREAGRHGVIYFKLDVDSDSAVGQVIMKQGEWEDDYWEDIHAPHNQPSEMLTIRFVQVGLDRVVGRMNEYKDPVCGCNLDTIFEGHLEGDRIEGVYVSHGEGFHMTTSGNWSVDRYTRPPVTVTK